MRKLDAWPVFFKREWYRNWLFLVGFAITGTIITKFSLDLTEEDAKNSPSVHRHNKYVFKSQSELLVTWSKAGDPSHSPRSCSNHRWWRRFVNLSCRLLKVLILEVALTVIVHVALFGSGEAFHIH